MKNAFRPLTNEELQFVSGGADIVVTGTRPGGGGSGSGGVIPGFDWGWGGGGDSGNDYGGSGGGDDGYDPGLGHNDPALNPEAVKQGADQLKAELDDLVKKHGSFNVELPDGKIVSVETLLEGLGKISTAVDAGMLAGDALNGDLSVGAVAGFLVGLGVAATLPATTSALGVFVASTLAAKATEITVNAFFDYADQRLAELNAEIAQQSQNANPNTTPGIAFIEWFLDAINPTPPLWDGWEDGDNSWFRN